MIKIVNIISPLRKSSSWIHVGTSAIDTIGVLYIITHPLTQQDINLLIEVTEFHLEAPLTTMSKARLRSREIRTGLLRISTVDVSNPVITHKSCELYQSYFPNITNYIQDGNIHDRYLNSKYFNSKYYIRELELI